MAGKMYVVLTNDVPRFGGDYLIPVGLSALEAGIGHDYWADAEYQAYAAGYFAKKKQPARM